jgi:hypothetical protein
MNMMAQRVAPPPQPATFYLQGMRPGPYALGPDSPMMYPGGMMMPATMHPMGMQLAPQQFLNFPSAPPGMMLMPGPDAIMMPVSPSPVPLFRLRW